MVTFSIGNGANLEEFNVHKEFACYYSPVLDAAFNGGFVEGQTQTYQLDDIQPDAFRLFVQWLYSQNIDVVGPYSSSPSLDDGTQEEVDEDEDDAEMTEIHDGSNADVGARPEAGAAGNDDMPMNYVSRGKRRFIFQHPILLEQDMNLVQLWVLADKLLIPRLQNAVMIHLKKMDDYYWSTQWVNYAYQHTAPSSPLRQLAVDLAAYVIPGDWPPAQPEHFPHAMLIELASHMTVGHTGKEGIYRHFRKARDYLVDEGGEVEGV